MNKYFKVLVFAGFIFLVFGCKEDPKPIPPASMNYSNGVLIVNEGLFSNGTGTVTYSNRDGSVLQQNIFQMANSELPLGSITQSMAIVGEKAYIMVNNANSIEVVSYSSFKSVATIQNIEMPRYMVRVTNTKSFVTCWDGTIKVLDTEKDKLYAEIQGSSGQEKLLRIDTTVWVLNQGGLGIDSTISVINIITNEIDQTINIYPRPTGICEDKDGLIWVMCSGRASYHPGGASAGHLLAINKSDYLIEKDFVFPDIEKQPLNLIINETGDELFYLYPGGINRFRVNADTLVLAPFISYEGAFYSLGYDFKENQIYASDVLDYVQKGQIFVFDAITGTEKRSFKAGIVPSYFYFSE